MTPDTVEQFSAVYAEAAVAWLETETPQAVLWIEEEGRWDFCPAEEDAMLDGEVAFVLQAGWDGQLTLEATTDPNDDRYDARELTEEITEQLVEEGIARALLEALNERRERLAAGEEDESERPEADHEDGDD